MLFKLLRMIRCIEFVNVLSLYIDKNKHATRVTLALLILEDGNIIGCSHFAITNWRALIY